MTTLSEGNSLIPVVTIIYVMNSYAIAIARTCM